MKKVPIDPSKIIQDFQLEITKSINAKNIGKNIMVSPLSIYHILSLTSNGAANTTMVEMLQLLGHKSKLDLNKDNQTISAVISKLNSVKIANAIFTKFKPEPAFIKLIENYNSTIDELISVEQVNDWCSKKTENTINKIIEDINGVLMILINALYFKGIWEKKFDKNLNSKLPFFNFNKEEKITEFMNIKDNFDYYEDYHTQAIQLNYTKDNLKALIILPRKGNDINTYIKNFNKEKYAEIIKGLNSTKTDLSLPKFEIKYEEELNEVLISMGMKEAFGVADFSVMKKEKDIHVSKVIHKTYIKVDEEGTVAAAVTAVVMKRAIARVNRMVVDHPFLFVIRCDKIPSDHDILFFAKIESL